MLPANINEVQEEGEEEQLDEEHGLKEVEECWTKTGRLRDLLKCLNVYVSHVKK